MAESNERKIAGIGNFTFSTAGRIRFGWGEISALPAEAREMGTSLLLVTGSRPERHEALREQIEGMGLRVQVFSVEGEPTVDLVCSGVEQLREMNGDVIAGIGGGSVMDTAKAIAGLAANPGDPYRYLEVVGEGQPLTEPALPCICIPTTAGSGAEVTRNAVLASERDGVKVSLRSPYLLPRLSLVDPSLTVDCPVAQTAASGMDALTQLIEAWVTPLANPMTDGFCREGIPRIAGSLRLACAEPDNREAREAMSLGALLSGLALANAKLGAVHGFAGVLGGRYGAPHGAICARLLPEVFERNLAFLNAREDQAPATARFHEVARLLSGKPEAEAADAVAILRALCRDLKIPGLAHWGVREADFSSIAKQAEKASSMKGNPVILPQKELEGVLQAALE